MIRLCMIFSPNVTDLIFSVVLRHFRAPALISPIRVSTERFWRGPREPRAYAAGPGINKNGGRCPRLVHHNAVDPDFFLMLRFFWNQTNTDACLIPSRDRSALSWRSDSVAYSRPKNPSDHDVVRCTRVRYNWPCMLPEGFNRPKSLGLLSMMSNIWL